MGSSYGLDHSKNTVSVTSSAKKALRALNDENTTTANTCKTNIANPHNHLPAQ